MNHRFPWSHVSPYAEVRAVVRAARDQDVIIRERIVQEVSEGLGLRVVVLDPDDDDFSMELLLDALADLGE